MSRIGLPFSIFAVLYWGILFRNTKKNMTLNFVYFIALFLFVGLPFYCLWWIMVWNNAVFFFIKNLN